MYDIKLWQDEVLDQHGAVLQEGTLHDEVNMNRMEHGVLEADLLATMLVQQNLQHKRILKDLEGEVGQVTLTNAEQFPFNNSIKTLSLLKNRDTIDYRITVEIISKNENVGEVIASDKQLNGFKLNFTGSAKSVTIKYYIQGGMYQ